MAVSSWASLNIRLCLASPFDDDDDRAGAAVAATLSAWVCRSSGAHYRLHFPDGDVAYPSRFHFGVDCLRMAHVADRTRLHFRYYRAAPAAGSAKAIHIPRGPIAFRSS